MLCNDVYIEAPLVRQCIDSQAKKGIRYVYPSPVYIGLACRGLVHFLFAATFTPHKKTGNVVSRL